MDLGGAANAAGGQSNSSDFVSQPLYQHYFKCIQNYQCVSTDIMLPRIGEEAVQVITLVFKLFMSRII